MVDSSSEENDKPNLQQTLRKICDHLNADIFIYFGEINSEGADELCEALRKKTRRSVILVLATYGGDPDAAYRMGRRIQKVYKRRGDDIDEEARFYVFLPTTCKSAGTLLVLGADSIFISRDAEVGPIDIQLRKHDEVGELASGLLPGEALNAVTARARATFLAQFRSLRTDRALPFSTKLAAEVASTMTVGLFKPILEQLDPMRLAEMERSQRIGSEYGKRLDNGNLKTGSLVRLLGQYPSHNFIIDSDEMAAIFHNVEESGDDLNDLEEHLQILYKNFIDREHPFVLRLEPSDSSGQDEEDDDTEALDGRGPDGSGSGAASRDGDGPPGGDREDRAEPERASPSAHNDASSEDQEGRDGRVASMQGRRA